MGRRNRRTIIVGVVAAFAVGLPLLTATANEPSQDDIIAVVRAYEQAANSGEADAFREVLALDDARFREIEDHIPNPFGKETVEQMFDWRDANPDFDYHVAYRDIEAFKLGEASAYAIAMADWTSPEGSGTSRVTFVLVRSDAGAWRILHGHWSALPCR